MDPKDPKQEQTPPTNPAPYPENAPQPTVNPNSEHAKVNPLAAMQPGEEFIIEIRRHPFGIISLYLLSFVGFAAACGIILLLSSRMAPGSVNGGLSPLTLSLIGIVLLMMILILGVSTMVYWQNRWIVTSDSVTQITQRGLFNRQTSQLSFGNLEDVTAEQEGLLSSIFNFGTLKVETAGEHSKFYFLYCPNPNFYARKILMAREIFLQNELSGQRRLNRL